MNRIFRIIWSQAMNAWIVVSELTTRRGKRSGGAEVDERIAPQALVLDRDMVEGSPPATPWRLRASILAALLTVHAPAWAADRWWDPNNTAVGLGGSGTWGTSGTLWSPNNDGVSGPFSTWNNAALDDAFFGGTAGTVTLGGPITVHNITFQTDGYSLTGGSLILGGSSPIVSVTTGTTSIGSPITSTNGLIKAGSGALTLNGSNTFGGGIDINGGALTLNAANSFTGTINATGGNLAIGAIGDAALGSVGNLINLGNGRTLSTGGTISASRTINLVSGISNIRGSGLGGVFYTGAGGMNVGEGIALTNNANNYQGQTQFTTLPSWGGDSYSFSSIADLGVASALGAPTTVANGTILLGPGGGQALGASTLHYTGTGNSSNRNWQFRPGNYAGGAYLQNSGSGTLTLTGAIAAVGGSQPFGFSANSADMDVLGVISSNTGRTAVFTANGGRTIRLGTANTFSGQAQIQGAGAVEASLLANTGVAGSLGTGSIFINGGNLSYLGAGESTNKNWTISSGALNNNGTGALALSGTVAIGGTATLGGSFTGADNVISGVISGAGNLRSAGNATWTLTGANTYTGSTIVNSGVLRAGTASAFGGSTVVQVNGGTLDLNDFDKTFSTLSGTGGTVDLGAANLTLQGAAGTTATYAGSITGSGGLTKLGASTQTLTGVNTYTGATTIGGGTLALNFSGAGGPISNIISSASTLNMGGGTLTVTGAAGEANTQTFNGLFVTGGNNNITATSGIGGSTTVNFGAITRTTGLINFGLPVNGNFTTTNTTLGGWATVNGTDYAKVVGGNILAFTDADYTDKDDASTWSSGEFISDSDADIDSFFGTVGSTIQLGGLQFTTPDATTTITVAGGQTLGIDGTIIVAPSVLNNNQTITGGSITGTSGGGVLGIQQNSTGNFTIASQIVDNGGSIGFTKAGTGLVTLSNATSNYTGPTTVAQGMLSVNNIGNGGVASSIGASSAASSNLVLEGSTLRYTGTSTSSDRGFTIAKSGAILGSGIEVTNAAANLSFSGLVTSADGANFTKSGAGTLTLSNDANDYTGITTVTGGLLSVDTLANGGQVSGIGASSAASANLVLNGGGLQYTGATVSTDRGFTLGASNGTVDVSNAATTLTVNGTVVQEAGGNRRLTKNGAGTLVLSGTNTYTGGNTVNAGVLRAGSTQAFGAPSTAGVMTLANAAGVTLDLNNFNNTVGPLDGGGVNGGNVTLGSATLTIAGGNGNYSGTISGTGGVTRTSGGTQTFSGCNNTYTGATTLQGATLQVDCLANGGQASGIGASSSASTNLTFASGNLNYTGGTVSIDRGFNLSSGWGVIDVVNGTTLGFSGQVVGGGELYKDNAGTLVLSGNNTYTNNTHVRGGTLRAGSNTAFGSTNSFWMDNAAGALLDLNNFNANAGALIGGGAAGGNIALGTGTLTIRDGLNQTYAGAISGTGNLVKNGAGTQTLSGCNSSYSGTTTINAGVLAVSCLENGGVNSAIGASSAAPANLVLNGGTLRYTGAGGSTDRQFTLGTSGGTFDASGTGIIELASTAPVTLAGANVARTLTLTGTNNGYNLLAAQLDNNGAGITSLTKTGTGTWRLTNNNSTYTGVTRINGGILSVDQMANGGLASSIGASTNAAANLVIGNGSTLRYTGAGDTTDRRFTLDTGVTFIESSGTGALQFTNTGAVTLTGTNTARTIALGGTNTGANTMGGAIGNNGTGATTLAKNDSGTWVLTGNNTYTGNTVINNGNLVIGNGGTSGNLGTGNVIVDSPTSTLSMNRSDTVVFNATMSGPGTFAQIGTGTTTLTANNSIGATQVNAGTLDVNGTLNTATIAMNGTSTLNVDGTVQASGGMTAAITGDAGNGTININSGATLRANGDLGDGSDAVTVAGTLDTGSTALSLGAGNDTLTLNDGAVITGPSIDAGAGTADNLVVNNALALTLGGTGFSGFEQLTKNNTGTLTLTGNQSYSAGTAINGGTLDVNGTLETASVSISGSTTLNVDGTVQGMGGATATLTGTAGNETIVVNTGATLTANGNLGDGIDNLTLSGALNTGTGILDLGAGDETFTLRDGAVISGLGVSGGTGTDQLVLDNAGALAFNGGTTTGFESLLKQNTGIATMTGSQSFAAGTAIAGGTLDVDGALETPAVTLADNATLNVDGSLQAAGGTAASIAGSAGANSVSVGIGGTLLANGDLGAGVDTLDVAGTLDIGGGVFALGDGDDNFVVHDSTVVIGTVDGGAGQDTRTYDISSTANLGALANFEAVTKSGTGTLNINGPGATDLQQVEVLGGTLNVGPSGSVVATAGSTLDTVVASGATLNVDGSFGCGSGNDSMAVSGTVSGSGTIDLCDGDDTLTLNDGALLNNAISGGTGIVDALVLNNTGALAFDGSMTTGFESLLKQNAGTATMIGSQSFTAGTSIIEGVLDVDGTLETPTVTLADNTVLNIDGSLQAAGGAPASITGSTGANTVTIGADGTLLASGDLGAGNDVLDVAGTLNTMGGTFALGDGDDILTIHDDTHIIGTVAAGAGNDTFNTDIATVADLGAVQGFETLSKTGAGTLNINGPASSDFTTVNVLAGTLNVTPLGAVIPAPGNTLATTVASGAILNVDGDYGCGAGNDTMSVSGTVSGSGTIDLCGGDDILTLHDGAVLSTAISGGTGTSDVLVLDTIASLAFDGGNATNFELLQKDNAGTATLTGMQSFVGGTTVNGGVLDVDGVLETPTVMLADNTTLNIDGFLQATGGTVASITGGAGVSTVIVGASGTLLAIGDLGAGNDVLDVAGTLNTMGGTFALGDGDDILIIHDNTNILGTVAAGTGNDTLNADIATLADLGAVQGFDVLSKAGTGMLNINGPASSDFTTVSVNAGTLNVTAGGNVSAQSSTVDAGATLLVSGSFAGTAGDDLLDVAGTLDMGAGAFLLGDGNDNFVVHDGTVVLGTVDGGAGLDTRTYDINTTADVGALVNFEAVTKTGTGTLNINGPTATDLQEVSVLGGTLNIGPAGSVVSTAGSTLTATVANGATLNVDGSYGCGDGNDTMSVSGTVSGSGIIDMCDGEDTLTLNDGAVLSNVINGGGHGTGDTVVLNNANALSFDGGNTINFEFLQKDNAGVATLTGTQSFIGGTAINGGTLDVDGTLETPTVTLADNTTLNVDGSVQATGRTAATITGSTGANTVSVGAGGALVGTGDLGDGNDTLDVAGTLDTMGGTFALGDGDDTLTIHDGTTILGAVLAGAGNDTFNANIATSADLGAVQAFETLSKTGVGVLNVNGPLSSDFTTVNVNAGTLNVGAGGSVTAQDTTVAVGSTLHVGGSYSGTTGDDLLDVAGTLDMGSGTFALGDGNDTLTIHDGTQIFGTVSAGAGTDTFNTDIAVSADLGAMQAFETLSKTGAGVLNVNGPMSSDFTTVDVLAGTLNIAAGGSVVAASGNILTTTVASGATLNVDGSYGCGDGNDTMSVSGTVSGSGTIDLCDGEDTLTLNDGAVLNNIISGGGHGTGDTVVLNNANALSFDGGNTINFEFLQKDNAGVATLTGTQSFVGGTAINGGTLDVDGALETPTVTLADGTTLNVDGSVQATGGTAATITGSTGANTVSVGAGGNLVATGDLGDGNDTLDVAGTLDTMGGTFALGDGDDTLTIHDGTTILGAVLAGAGNDTFNANIATSADLGAVQAFETLSKTGVGVLDVNGPLSSDFTTVNVNAGTLNVAAGGSVSAQNTTVTAGATLNVQGSFTGTAGDDRFTSSGTVIGALAFGTGDDAVDFMGGDMSGLRSLDGGSGTDRLGFSGMTLDDEDLPTLAGWERVELLSGSELTLGSALDLSGGVLAIDATSQLDALAGANIGGNVENAGLINVGANRLAIDGGYTGNSGALQLTVSPGNASAGGVNITGDVTGTTAVSFISDGTQKPNQAVSILVISSPNDNAATAGTFSPADAVNGVVRVQGSIFPWTFGQEADHNWYLGSDASGILPELPGYAVLPSLSQAAIQENNRLLFQRTSGVRGDTPRCEAEDKENKRAYWVLTGECRGVWMAATGSELEMGGNPGFEFSGDSIGLYVGTDLLLQDRETRTMRGGLFAGFLRGNYWTTGVNSTDLPGIGESNVRMDTPSFGMYSSTNWRGGSYVDLSLVGQLPKGTISVADGFREEISGNTLTLSAQIGHRFHLDNGWTVEPQVQLSAIAMAWDDKVDAGGKQIDIDDDLLGTARAAVRAEKLSETARGARVRTWATLGLQDTVGEKDNALNVMAPGSTESLDLPNHEAGLAGTFDLGVEAELNKSVSLFGVVSYDKSIEGSDSEQRQANVGIRIRW